MLGGVFFSNTFLYPIGSDTSMRFHDTSEIASEIAPNAHYAHLHVGVMMYVITFHTMTVCLFSRCMLSLEVMVSVGRPHDGEIPHVFTWHILLVCLILRNCVPMTEVGRSLVFFPNTSRYPIVHDTFLSYRSSFIPEIMSTVRCAHLHVCVTTEPGG